VVGAGGFKQSKILIGKMERFAVQYLGKRCSTPTVAGILAFIAAPRIVKNGEERHHWSLSTGVRSQAQTILKDTRPMGDAVDTPPG
jgi:hypothetical protein